MSEDVLKTLLQSISSKSQRVHLQDYLDSLSRDVVSLVFVFIGVYHSLPMFFFLIISDSEINT